MGYVKSNKKQANRTNCIVGNDFNFTNIGFNTNVFFRT